MGETYECLSFEDLTVFVNMTDLWWKWLTPTFIELQNNLGQSFYWMLEDGLWCIL